MALTSALFTGLSGLNVNQTRLNVTGNNIANANTVAYKSSRALFAPQFYITDAAGGPPNATFGGENPSQRGLGATVAAIEKDFTQGAMETTGKNTDLAIDGEGFFIVEGDKRAFTRDGSFGLNANNDIVTSSGDYVMGYKSDTNGNIIAGALEHLNVPSDTKSAAKATTNVALQGNLNSDGDVAAGASVLSTKPLQSISAGTLSGTSLLSDLSLDGTTPLFDPAAATPDVLTLEGVKGGRTLPALTFTPDAASTVDDLCDFFNQGMQIKTDDPPTGTFTPGAVFDPLTNSIKVTSNVGTENAIALGGTAFKSTNPNMTMGLGADPTSNPTGESRFTSMEVYDSLGNPVQVDVTMTLAEKSDAGTKWSFIATSPDNTRAKDFTPGGAGATDFYGAILSSGELQFDNNGKLMSSSGTQVSLDRAQTGAVPTQAVDLDFSSLSSLGARASELVMNEQDGYPTGILNGFSVGGNGLITATFSNGQNRTMGQVAIAMFDNKAGLVDLGGNKYVSGANSGTPIITAPTEQSAGTVRAGSLEQSNVDLSREFINLIISSTGFTAASRVITTSDQLITELLNTSR